MFNSSAATDFPQYYFFSAHNNQVHFYDEPIPEVKKKKPLNKKKLRRLMWRRK